METPRGKLTLKRAGALTEHVYLFAPPATIGRFDPSMGPIDVDLGNVDEGSYVSRKHARIDYVDGVWTIRDLGSSNGTFVLRDDFEKVDSAELADGQEIALGNARLWFEVYADAEDEDPSDADEPESEVGQVDAAD